MTLRHIGCNGFFLLLGASVGTAQQPYWIPTGGPEAGNVAVVFAAEDQTLYAGTIGDGIFVSTDGGDEWLARSDGLSSLDVRAISEDNSGRMFAGTGDGSVYYSDNKGSAWSLTSPTEIGEIYAVQPMPGGALFAGGNGGLVRSSDEGATWELLDLGMTQPLIISTIRHIRDGILVAGSLGMGAFRTTDNGDTWAQSFAGSPDNIVYSLFQDDNLLLAATALGLFTSTDEGISWSELADPPGGYVLDIVAVTDYYAVTTGGVFRSTDNGESWLPANDGLGDLEATCITFGSTLYLGTIGGGVYEALSVNIADPENEGTASRFSLGQNYPNPFNPSTTFPFSIPHSSIVSLTVYDILGGEVATVVNEKMSPGTYRREWNAAGLPSGVYYYQMEAGNLLLTRKLILLR